jgi:hypothetical protein
MASIQNRGVAMFMSGLAAVLNLFDGTPTSLVISGGTPG